MTDEELADDIRDAVKRLNELAGKAADRELAVQYRMVPHHTTRGDAELLLVEVTRSI